MDTKDKIKVMQAYVDGKTIQVKCLREILWRDYDQIEEPAWNWLERNYRIKPTPTYRPYKPEELVQLKGKWLKYNLVKHQINAVFLVTAMDTSKVFVGGNWRMSNELYENFTHEDGSPCGVLEE